MMSAISSGGPVSTFNELLDVIKNADLYATRIETLQEQERKSNEATQKLSTAQNLTEALENAKKLESASRETLKQAQAKAQQLEREAESKAESIINEANQYRANVERELKIKIDEMTEITSNLSVAHAELQTSKEEAAKQRKEAAQLTDSNSELRHQIEQKRSALKALLA